MYVNGKLLLNSAKDILRSYQQRTSNGSVKLNPDSAQSLSKINSTDSTKGNAIKVRMLELQSKLKEIQNAYTREQVRQDYLLNRSDELSGKLEYKKEKLFPEYNSAQNTESLKNMVAKKLPAFAYPLLYCVTLWSRPRLLTLICSSRIITILCL